MHSELSGAKGEWGGGGGGWGVVLRLAGWSEGWWRGGNGHYCKFVMARSCALGRLFAENSSLWCIQLWGLGFDKSQRVGLGSSFLRPRWKTVLRSDNCSNVTTDVHVLHRGCRGTRAIYSGNTSRRSSSSNITALAVNWEWLTRMFSNEFVAVENRWLQCKQTFL